MIKIRFVAKVDITEGALGLFLEKNGSLCASAKKVDTETKGALSHFIKNNDKDEKIKDPTVLPSPLGLDKASHVILIPHSENPLELGGKTAAALLSLKSKTATIWGEDTLSPESAADFALGLLLRSWKFDKYLTKDEAKSKLKEIHICVSDEKACEKAFKNNESLYESIALAREVVSEPANVIYPEALANIAKTLEKDGVKVEIFTPKELSKMGFNALLGVGQGSINDSRLVVLQWHGGKKDEKPVAFVGKGVTFDTGGISIKPSSKMEEMKMDMAGSAVVMGLMKALAQNKVKVNAVGVMGLVENMPSGTAQRPGDIVKSLSGQTIEVINTDAEGRLVLADALWYTQDRFKPKAMIDLATLTGAVFIALGYRYAGLMGNNDKIISQLQKASKTTGEKLWHLPLDAEFAKSLKSDAADVKNSDYSVGAGTIMAAQFLECFVNKTPWAHLDIAMTAWATKAEPLHAKGATGYGIRLLYQWVQDHYAE